jgi:hypothetical protein
LEGVGEADGRDQGGEEGVGECGGLQKEGEEGHFLFDFLGVSLNFSLICFFPVWFDDWGFKGKKWVD